MSATAQSKDINDPVVIHEFASEVRTEQRLDYLYTLTVADINATNPNAVERLARDADASAVHGNPQSAAARTRTCRSIARRTSSTTGRRRWRSSQERGIARERALALWDDPDPEFFMQHSVGQIVSLTEAIAKHDLATGPLVLVRDVVGHASEEGATEIFLYTRDQPRLFAASVIAIDQLGLSIHDARIHTSAGNLCFNSYIVLDESGHSISANAARCRHIERTLIAQLSDLERVPRTRQTPHSAASETVPAADARRIVERPGAAVVGAARRRIGPARPARPPRHHLRRTRHQRAQREDHDARRTRRRRVLHQRQRRRCRSKTPRGSQSVTRTICERLDQQRQRRNPRELSRMNPFLDSLLPYPFERMNALKAGLRSRSNAPHIALSIGEPKHAAAQFLVDAATDADVRAKPVSARIPPRAAATRCAPRSARGRRRDFNLRRRHVDRRQRHMLPVSGTREALFSFAQCVLVGTQRQLRGVAEPVLPDLRRGDSAARHRRPYYVAVPGSHRLSAPTSSRCRPRSGANCELLFICSPGNPTGAVMPHRTADAADRTRRSVRLRHRVRRVLFGDLSGRDPPPAGLLQACAAIGRDDYARCVVFHSLSKRSNLPGLRSGFVAGDAAILERYFLYRTYHGCAMPAHVQHVSELAWSDEAHVVDNRARLPARSSRP